MAKKPKGPNPRWTADEYRQARGGGSLRRMFSRSSGVDAFTPSAITDPYDRACADFGEHQRPWLRQGMHSRAWLIAAPGVDPEAFTAATRRLDKGLQGVMAPLKPGWYRRAERTGYLILFVPGVVAFVVCLLAGVNWGATIGATVFAMGVIGYPLAAGLTSLARGQGARRENEKALPVLAETDAVARPLQPANQNAVMRALDRGEDEGEIQALAFQAAGTGADADRAAGRLVDLALGGSPAR